MKFSLIIAGLLALLSHTNSDTITPKEAEDIATEVYIYAYPLITMDVTKEVTTNTVEPQEMKAPLGQFANVRNYPNPSFKDVTAPNADTLYSAAWLDLDKEPYILHVPDEDGRYYLMPMLSAWTDVFAAPGTRTTETKAGDFIITGPHWTGKAPEGMHEYKSPTNMVWILGRTYSTGTPEDYAKVHEIQDKYTLTPLSAYGKPYTPPKGTFDPNIDMKTPVRDQVNAMGAAEYFTRFARLLHNNPPTKEDSDIVIKMGKIGIKLGLDLDFDKLNPIAKQALEKAPGLGIKKIGAHEKNGELDVNGWSITKQTGVYGTDYLQRALVAYIGLGANLPQDAIYPFTRVDSNNQILNGKNRYIIHFAKNDSPPVNGFWSLTMYNENFFFVENPLNRYTLSPRNDLKFNPDGSLDLFIQHESPGKGKESNWLPAPEDNFILMFRFYWPKSPLLNGIWQPPAVKKIN